MFVQNHAKFASKMPSGHGAKCLFWVHPRTLTRHMGQTKGPIMTVDTALERPNYCLSNAL